LLQIVSLPFFAGALRLSFRKAGYTYFEHLVINAFMRGQALILASILLPFLYFGWINRELHSGILQLLQLVFVFWTFLQLFNSRKKWWIVKKISAWNSLFGAGNFSPCFTLCTVFTDSWSYN
jgi:hypothetical protein